MLQVAKDRANGWSDCAKSWTVMAEQPSVLYDLFNTEPAIAKAFASKWFRSALISSEDTSGNEPGSENSSSGSGTSSNAAGGEGSSSSSKAPRQQLRFVFALPPLGQQDELDPLLVSAGGTLAGAGQLQADWVRSRVMCHMHVAVFVHGGGQSYCHRVAGLLLEQGSVAPVNQQGHWLLGQGSCRGVLGPGIDQAKHIPTAQLLHNILCARS